MSSGPAEPSMFDDEDPADLIGYDDGLLAIAAGAIVIRRYDLLLRTRTIPFSDLTAIERIEVSRLRGGVRVWGAAPPSRWFNLDVHRRRKPVAFLIDTGDPIKPCVTPTDPEGFVRALRSHGIGGV